MSLVTMDTCFLTWAWSITMWSMRLFFLSDSGISNWNKFVCNSSEVSLFPSERNRRWWNLQKKLTMALKWRNLKLIPMRLPWWKRCVLMIVSWWWTKLKVINLLKFSNFCLFLLLIFIYYLFFLFYFVKTTSFCSLKESLEVDWTSEEAKRNLKRTPTDYFLLQGTQHLYIQS